MCYCCERGTFEPMGCYIPTDICRCGHHKDKHKYSFKFW